LAVRKLLGLLGRPGARRVEAHDIELFELVRRQRPARQIAALDRELRPGGRLARGLGRGVGGSLIAFHQMHAPLRHQRQRQSADAAVEIGHEARRRAPRGDRLAHRLLAFDAGLQEGSRRRLHCQLAQAQQRGTRRRHRLAVP